VTRILVLESRSCTEKRASEKQTYDISAVALSFSELAKTTTTIMPSMSGEVREMTKESFVEGVRKFHEFYMMQSGEVCC